MGGVGRSLGRVELQGFDVPVRDKMKHIGRAKFV